MALKAPASRPDASNLPTLILKQRRNEVKPVLARCQGVAATRTGPCKDCRHVRNRKVSRGEKLTLPEGLGSRSSLLQAESSRSLLDTMWTDHRLNFAMSALWDLSHRRASVTESYLRSF